MARERVLWRALHNPRFSVIVDTVTAPFWSDGAHKERFPMEIKVPVRSGEERHGHQLGVLHPYGDGPAGRGSRCV